MLAQTTPPTTGSTTLIIVVIAVLILAAIVAFVASRRRSAALHQRFGTEYDRTVATAGSRERAEKELAGREARVRKLHIQPLAPGARDRYADEWRTVQATFVDEPSEAVRSADRLVTNVMRDRGYPVDDAEQRVDDLVGRTRERRGQLSHRPCDRTAQQPGASDNRGSAQRDGVVPLAVRRATRIRSRRQRSNPGHRYPKEGIRTMQDRSSITATADRIPVERGDLDDTGDRPAQDTNSARDVRDTPDTSGDVRDAQDTSGTRDVRSAQTATATPATPAAPPRPPDAPTATATVDTPLLPRDVLDDFRSRWDAIQVGFVDQPQASVHSAQDLVDQLVDRLSQSFTQQREVLERGSGSGDGDTEAQRVALQQYRSFFNRLLST